MGDQQRRPDCEKASICARFVSDSDSAGGGAHPPNTNKGAVTRFHPPFK